MREAREGAEQGHCELRTGWERSRVRLDKDHGVAWCPECFQTKADTSQPPTGEEEIPDFELSLWLWAMRVSSRGLGSEKLCSRRPVGGCCGLTGALPRLARPQPRASFRTEPRDPGQARAEQARGRCQGRLA